MDLLYICKRNKLRILECPITWTDDAVNSKLTYKDGIVSVLKLFEYKFKTNH